MVINYDVTGQATKTRVEVLGYGFIVLGFSLLTLGMGLYYRAIWYWIGIVMLGVIFLIIGFGLISIK